MVRMKNCIVVLAVVFCLSAAAFYVIIPTLSSPGTGGYDPWLDINDDGTINMKDVSAVARVFGTSGQNITKAYPLYDSGWVNLTGYMGEHYTLVDNLSLPSTGVTVDARQKTQAWNKTYGGTRNDAFYSLVQTSDGGYAMAGFLGLQWCLAKTDAEGSLLWNKTYDGTIAGSLIETSDGGYALAGQALELDLSSYGACLIKTDANGSMLWSKTYGGTSDDVAYSLVETSDGGYALAGYTPSFGAGGKDAYLFKTDANGNMLWNKTYGGTSDDVAYSLVETSDGGYALAGYTSSFGAGAFDSYLVKTDANGNMLWNRTYGGLWFDLSYSLVETSDGGYALAGEVEYVSGDSDAKLVKTDAGGNILWNKTYGEKGFEAFYSLVQSVDGGYALAGITDSFGAGGKDAYLFKTDPNGNMLWNKTYGGTSDDGAWGVVEAVDGGYALTGFTYSFGTGGSCDFYLVKTEGESGLAWVQSTANSITVAKDADASWGFVRVQIWKKR